MEFKIQDLSNIFENINHKRSITPGFDYGFDVFQESNFVGELFYSTVFEELVYIKDNFPSPRKAYRIDFPIKTVEFFIQVIESAGIKLIFADKN